ncbi:MAG: nucleoside-diphosphate kinase [bacterium]
MSKNRIFFMIKPDGLALEDKIMYMVRSMAGIVSSKSFKPADMDKIEQLYAMHKGAFFYERLLNFFRGRDIKVFVLEEKEGYKYKKGFVEDFADLVGNTDPSKAKPGTIRSMSTDSIARSINEERAVNNLVHRSRTLEEAEQEASIFFEDISLENLCKESLCQKSLP